MKKLFAVLMLVTMMTSSLFGNTMTAQEREAKHTVMVQDALTRFHYQNANPKFANTEKSAKTTCIKVTDSLGNLVTIDSKWNNTFDYKIEFQYPINDTFSRPGFVTQKVKTTPGKDTSIVMKADKTTSSISGKVTFSPGESKENWWVRLIPVKGELAMYLKVSSKDGSFKMVNPGNGEYTPSLLQGTLKTQFGDKQDTTFYYWDKKAEVVGLPILEIKGNTTANFDTKLVSTPYQINKAPDLSKITEEQLKNVPDLLKLDAKSTEIILKTIKKGATDYETVKNISKFLESYRPSNGVTGLPKSYPAQYVFDKKNGSNMYCTNYSVLFSSIASIYGIPTTYVVANDVIQIEKQDWKALAGHALTEVYLRDEKRYILVDTTRNEVYNTYDRTQRTLKSCSSPYADAYLYVVASIPALVATDTSINNASWAYARLSQGKSPFDLSLVDRENANKVSDWK